MDKNLKIAGAAGLGASLLAAGAFAVFRGDAPVPDYECAYQSSDKIRLYQDDRSVRLVLDKHWAKQNPVIDYSGDATAENFANALKLAAEFCDKGSEPSQRELMEAITVSYNPG